jgi:hypothetical protein
MERSFISDILLTVRSTVDSERKRSEGPENVCPTSEAKEANPKELSLSSRYTKFIPSKSDVCPELLKVTQEARYHFFLQFETRCDLKIEASAGQVRCGLNNPLLFVVKLQIHPGSSKKKRIDREIV